MTPQEEIERDERLSARDQWRRCGGSRRRPLRSFSTQRERAQKRAELKGEREAALALVREDEATHAEWVATCILNPHLSANNAAIVAARLPGKIVGTARYWRSNGAGVLKGQTAALYLTGGPRVKFAPVAAFAACQTSAGPALAAVESDGPMISDDLPDW